MDITSSYANKYSHMITKLNLKTFKHLNRVLAQFTYIPYGLLYFAVRGNELEGKY